MAHGDCETCVHYESGLDICEECEYGEHEYYDHYEKASKEDIAKREEEERQKAEAEAMSGYIDVDIPDDFRKAFEMAKKCAASIHFRKIFMSVYATSEGTLVASDTYRLIELKCEVPEPLKEKCIVKLEDNRAAIHQGDFPNYKAIFEACNEYDSVPYKGITLNPSDPEPDGRGFKITCLEFPGVNIPINKAFLDVMCEILTGDIRAFYPEKNLAPVLFTGDNARMLIVPLRLGDE
ncbi:MAG: hypothetical protein ABFD18_06420 [Syntrophomonas sp.]